MSFEEAYQESKLRLGFVFQWDDPFVGIDLDGCIDENGGWLPWGREIVEQFSQVAYCEISPSGRGVKIFARARLASESGVRVQFGEHQGIEIYSANRFFAVTGECVSRVFDDLPSAQDQVDVLVDEHCLCPPKQELKPVKMLANRAGEAEPRYGLGLTLEEAAARYAAATPAVGYPGRGDGAFKLAGQLFSKRHANGSRLTLEQVISLVLEWAGRCTPPLEPGRAVAAVESAQRGNGNPPPESVLEATYPEAPLVDISLITTGLMPKPGQIHPPTPTTTGFPTIKPKGILIGPTETIKPVPMPPGLITNICDYYKERSFYYLPNLAIGAAIALVGTITGRLLKSNTGDRTNVMICGVAPSGSGKDGPRKCNVEILADLEYGVRLLGAEDISSGRAIHQMLAEFPARLCMFDEFSEMLSSTADTYYRADIVRQLKILSSSASSFFAGVAKADSRMSVPGIWYPHLCVYATATPAIWENITKSMLADGLAGRFLFFEEGERPAPNFNIARPEEIPASIMGPVSKWVERHIAAEAVRDNPPCSVYQYTPQALERHKKFCLDVHNQLKSDDPDAEAIWARAGGRLGSISLIVAASRTYCSDEGEITLADVELAIEIVLATTRLLVLRQSQKVYSTDHEKWTKRILEVITENGGRATRKQISLGTRAITLKFRDACLQDLMAQGLIEQSLETLGAHRPTTFYTLITE